MSVLVKIILFNHIIFLCNGITTIILGSETSINTLVKNALNIGSPTLAFLKQIAFSVHQQNMKIPYTSCASSTTSEVFLFLAILMKTHEGKSDSHLFLLDSTCFSYKEHFIVQETLRIELLISPLL